jgi:hypothetical protein
LFARFCRRNLLRQSEPCQECAEPTPKLPCKRRKVRRALGHSSTARRLATAFALGAALGTGLDAIHVYGDVETYSNEVLGRLGWFVPVEFGLAGVASVVAIPVLEKVLRVAPRPWSTWERVRELPLLIGLYLTSVAANGANATLFGAALLVLVTVRLVVAPAPGDWAFALVAALVGPVVEATIHALGAFDYTEPDFLGIPVWLPALWAIGGIAIRRIFGPLALVPEPDEPAQRAHVG